MNQYQARLELKSKLQQELLSFVELEDVQQNYFDHDGDTKEEFWHDQRDEWINELYDRLVHTLEVIGYAKGLEWASALGYWSNYDNNILGIEITNSETLGFVACYEYVHEEGLVYDVVDAYLKDEFYVELNK